MEPKNFVKAEFSHGSISLAAFRLSIVCKSDL